MKKILFVSIIALTFLVSCNKDEKILDTLNTYNTEMESKGYHFGDKINFPKEVTENAESISISFGDKESSDLIIDPKFFTLGDNAVTINIIRDGKTLTQDATINVFAKKPEANLMYEIVKDYPHDKGSFVQGFQLEGNTIYESDGQEGKSRILKYTLGSTNAIAQTKQADSIFSEGSTIVGNKVYQLTWKNKKIFSYDRNSLKFLQEFSNPNVMGEGWGLTYDGKNLIASDGTKNLYYLDANDPSKMVKYISVAGNSSVFDQLNELEFHNGFIYANVWHQPFILKINPNNGEVVGKIDFSLISKKYTDVDSESVLNGIAFKGENMLVTGKNWDKIYEVKIK